MPRLLAVVVHYGIEVAEVLLCIEVPRVRVVLVDERIDGENLQASERCQQSLETCNRCWVIDRAGFHTLVEANDERNEDVSDAGWAAIMPLGGLPQIISVVHDSLALSGHALRPLLSHGDPALVCCIPLGPSVARNFDLLSKVKLYPVGAWGLGYRQTFSDGQIHPRNAVRYIVAGERVSDKPTVECGPHWQLVECPVGAANRVPRFYKYLLLTNSDDTANFIASTDGAGPQTGTSHAAGKVRSDSDFCSARNEGSLVNNENTW